MKNIIYKSFVILFLAVNFVACSKEDEGHHDHSDATLTISSPQTGSEFKTGDTITITAVANSTAEMHGYQILASKVSDGTEINKKDAHAHGTTLNIKETFVNTVASGQDVRIKVTVVLDHDQNTLEKEVTFKTK